MKIRHLACILAVCALCISCLQPAQNVSVVGVSVEPESVNLVVGESRPLTVTVILISATLTIDCRLKAPSTLLVICQN